MGVLSGYANDVLLSCSASRLQLLLHRMTDVCLLLGFSHTKPIEMVSVAETWAALGRSAIRSFYSPASSCMLI